MLIIEYLLIVLPYCETDLKVNTKCSDCLLTIFRESALVLISLVKVYILNVLSAYNNYYY